MFFFSIRRNVSRRHYQSVYMDTDSNYMALSGELLDVIKPERRDTFPEEFERWMVSPYCPTHRAIFWDRTRRGQSVDEIVAQDCCRQYSKHDGRTPGKFKQEFKGSAIVALNSKTYICSERTDSDLGVKLSSKGLSKRTNKLSLNDYRSVLRTKRHVCGVNTGFVRKRNKTFTYSMIKRGLTYFYAKRRVCPDGVSTEPLAI